MKNKAYIFGKNPNVVNKLRIDFESLSSINFQLFL